MITVTEALAEIVNRVAPLPAEKTLLGPVELGRVLAEPIVGDRDLPPFNKSMMDGIAINSSSGNKLKIVEEIVAGRLPTRPIGPGEASRIMTGAALPEGADAVVMIEDCRFEGDEVEFTSEPRAGQHVQPKGREVAREEVVLRPGHRLRPAELALLAMVGRTSVLTYRRPTVAVLTTGDELVPAGIEPGDGQIRNSNGPMLAALAMQNGAELISVDHGRDDAVELRAKISRALAADVVLMSGGVSAGKLDLVPAALRNSGVAVHVHKVAMRPGKPLLFGTCGRSFVFGLAGNPVGSFVGFTLFVQPALAKLAGRAPAKPVRLPLAKAFDHHGDRPTYHPARIERAEVGEVVRLVAWLGSPDLKGLCTANCLAHFPAGERLHAAGETVDVVRFDD